MLPFRAFYMVRHGLTDTNVLKQLQGGTSDAPLNAEGMEGARALNRLLHALRDAGYPMPQVIATSPRVRSMKTGELAAEGLDIPMIEPDPDLRERDYGAAEGKSRQLLPVIDAMTQDERQAMYPGAEEKDVFNARALGAMRQIMEREEGEVLFSVHRGNFRAFGEYYGRDWQPGNTELFRAVPAPEMVEFPWKITQLLLDQGDVREVPVELARISDKNQHTQR